MFPFFPFSIEYGINGWKLACFGVEIMGSEHTIGLGKLKSFHLRPVYVASIMRKSSSNHRLILVYYIFVYFRNDRRVRISRSLDSSLLLGSYPVLSYVDSKYRFCFSRPNERLVTRILSEQATLRKLKEIIRMVIERCKSPPN